MGKGPGEQCDQIWRDLASLEFFKKIFGKIWRVCSVFVKILNLLWNFPCSFGPINLVVNGQILSKYSRHVFTDAFFSILVKVFLN